MTDAIADDTKAKKERSPSFPFIPLEKAVARARAVEEKHKRDPARLASVATTWGYGPKSSGLLQTAAALIQFGLLENVGTGLDRKVQLTELARRILFDTREGVRERSLKEAALKPRLIEECFKNWGTDRPADDHCVSYLIFDRGFNDAGARIFLKTYDETLAFSLLKEGDEPQANPSEAPAAESGAASPAAGPPTAAPAKLHWAARVAAIAPPGPVMRRSTVALTQGSQVTIEFPETIAKGELEPLKLWLDFMYRLAEGRATENEKKKSILTIE